jgi:hypothetical protein
MSHQQEQQSNGVSSKSEEEDEKPYAIPALQRPDDASSLFMSEPSGSEADSSAVRLPLDDDCSSHHRATTPLHHAVPNSPGNTSLSSWDNSPALQKKVFLQFPLPVRRKNRGLTVERSAQGGPTAVSMLPKKKQQSRGVSMPLLDDDDDESSKVGKLKAAQTSHSNNNKEPAFLLDSGKREFFKRGSLSSLDDSVLPDRDTEPRKRRLRATKSEEDYSIYGADLLPDVLPNLSSRQADASHDSVLMTLSDDSEEETAPHNSADDEKTLLRPPRVRGKPAQHRRQRSGDAAAANLTIRGRPDWKGMEQDRIPLPEGEGEDDDEEENDEETGAGPRPQRRTERTQKRDRSPPQNERTQKDRSPPWNERMQEQNGQSPPQELSTLLCGASQPQMMTGQYGSLPVDPRRPPLWGMHHQTPPRIAESQRDWMMSMSQLNPSPRHSQERQMLSSSYSSAEFSNTSSQLRRRNFAENNSDYSEDSYSSEGEPISVQKNRMHMSKDFSDLSALEHRFEDRNFRGTYQNVLRPHSPMPTNRGDSPFANLGKVSPEKAPRSSFLPTALLNEYDPLRCPTYVCPRCGTRQREFFSVVDAPQQLEGPSSYLAVYFAIYVIASLFIFGLEEGWKPLDCIYFAVVTLTTAGLGDFVPTTDANKIICSIFIYFGVACIGLLLGSYIARILDERASRDRESKMLNSCPNCTRIRTLKDAAARRAKTAETSRARQNDGPPPHFHRFQTERNVSGASPRQEGHAAMYVPEHHPHHRDHCRPASPDLSGKSSYRSQNPSVEMGAPLIANHSSFSPSTGEFNGLDSPFSPVVRNESIPSNVMGSPMTRQILGRQKHTRHYSIDIRGASASLYAAKGPSRKFSHDHGLQTSTITEHVPPQNIPTSDPMNMRREASMNNLLFDSDTDDESSGTTTSLDSPMDDLLDEQTIRIKTAKYVFLTLQQALVNSMVIIAVGSVGFYFIEGWSVINCWYYTTVFLTT